MICTHQGLRSYDVLLSTAALVYFLLQYPALLIGISCCTYLVIEEQGSKLIFQIDSTLASWMAKKVYA